jgi:hypothetical protein
MKLRYLKGLVAGALIFTLHGTAQSDSLSGTYSTTSYGKGYYAAVWIETEAGKFVKTLSLWGHKEWGGNYFYQFYSWINASKYNVTDAVTSATLYGNKTGLKFAWDGKDVNENAMPKGNYKLQIGTVEHNDIRSNTTTTFAFDGTNRAVTGQVNSRIKDVKFNIVANSTKITNDIKMQNHVVSQSPNQQTLFALNGKEIPSLNSLKNKKHAVVICQSSTGNMATQSKKLLILK